jgi:3-oxoacyl-[acyl-carrier protein] reductase
VTSPQLLDGRVALVTGASRGIGAAIARAFGRHGADVAVNYRSNHEAAAAVVADIQNSGQRAVAVPADVAEADETAAMLDHIDEQLGPVGALVCNAAGDTAGILTRHLAGGSVLDNAEAIRDRTTIQLDSTLGTCRAVVPRMRQAGGGTIALIGAAGTHRSTPGGLAETIIAKAAQDAAARLLAGELGPTASASTPSPPASCPPTPTPENTSRPSWRAPLPRHPWDGPPPPATSPRPP